MNSEEHPTEDDQSTSKLSTAITSTSKKGVKFHINQDKEGAKKEREYRKDWLNRLHIFQRYRELREEHALANWKRHSVEWNRIEQHIAQSIDKVNMNLSKDDTYVSEVRCN